MNTGLRAVLASGLWMLATLASATDAPTAMSSAKASDDPFAQPSSLPYQLPPFDRIHDDDFMAAFQAAMVEQLREVDAIADSAAPADFDNTIVAMERSGRRLARVSSVFFNLTASNTNEQLQQLETEVAPQLAAQQDTILLNPRLFARVESLYGKRAQLHLDAESLRLLERYHTRFVRAGARLHENQKAELRKINEELSRLTTRFDQNLLKETTDAAVVVDDLSQLDGLSPQDIAAAAAAAKARDLPGKYVIALQNTTVQPLLAELSQRSLRERLYKASIARADHGGETDNKAVIQQLVSLRARRAALLGYHDHAAYVLEDETARGTAAVNKMLAQLAPAAVSNAMRESADLQQLIDADKGGFKLAAWDWAYYAEKLRKARYDFDESQMKPYLELDSVLQNGVFYAANRLYGLTFKERKDLPVYQPDVRVFEVFNADGSALGLFLADFYKRDTKRGGAWMNEYVSQSALFGTQAVVVNNLNIPKPPAGEPCLLTFDEVTTMFHEFGHALHGLFSNVRYPYFAGTNVPRDFVEYPSQFNEVWATDPEVLKHYALHYQTGAPMPAALVDKVLAADKFDQGFATTEYLAAALLDQSWHQLPLAQAKVADVNAFERAALKKAGVELAQIAPRYRSPYFAHIFSGGYDAGYYAYIWSAVLDADTAEWFKENGGLQRANGERFRTMLLSRGGSVDAMTLYRQFRGRDPDIKPLLDRRGLTLPKAATKKSAKPAEAAPRKELS